MSDCRSPTPSLSVICQRAERCFSSSARALALVSSATSGSSCSGFSWTASSAFIPVPSCSATASTSWQVERRSSSSDAATTRRSRNSTSGRNPDSSISVVVLRLRGVQPQRGRNGERVGADPRGVEVAAVQLHDPPPVRVEVGLGDHARDVGAQLHRRAEELELRPGVLLRGVGDEQHGVRAGERRHGRRPVRRAQPADARRVDEHEPAFEDLARQPDLGVGEHRLVAGVARLRDVVGELVHRHLGALGRRVGRLADEHHLGGLGVPDDRRHGRRDVVVHGADGRVDQRVHQLALALLELAHDEHAHVRVDEPFARLGEPCAEIRALVGRGGLQRQVDQLDRSRYRHLGCLPLLGSTPYGNRPRHPREIPKGGGAGRRITGRLLPRHRRIRPGARRSASCG